MFFLSVTPVSPPLRATCKQNPSMVSRWQAVGQRLVGTWGAVLRHRTVLAGTVSDSGPPYRAASQALPLELRAHCPAPGNARARTMWDATAAASGRSLHRRARGMSSDSNSAKDADETHFGFQTVRSDEKAKLVRLPSAAEPCPV